MTFLKRKILNRKFFYAVKAADFIAQNLSSDKIVHNKQVFVAFSMEKEINTLVAEKNAGFA